MLNPGGEDRIRTCGTPLGVQRFSKPPLSTTQPPLRIESIRGRIVSQILRMMTLRLHITCPEFPHEVR